ncbi:MAG: DUF2157 domain-containing protein [Symploca sp. SIO3E6]|nr:DUF2157 domain-containing protein [Caldora sp. SIO3E6]
MPSDKFIRQLRQEAEQWQSEGLITTSVYEQLAQRYQFSNIETAARNRFVMILIGLGSLLLGLAIITLIAANWQTWSRELKGTLLLGLFVGVNTAGFYLWRHPTTGWQRRLGQGLLLLGALILGANMAVMSQLFHQSGLLYQLFLFWGLGVLAMAYSLRFTWLGILAILLIGSGYGQSLSEFTSIGEFFGLQLLVQYMPVLAGLMFIPLAYWCCSSWLFRLGAIAVVYSLEASLIQLGLVNSTAWIAAIACALPPALLWAYSDSLWAKHLLPVKSFNRLARTLAVCFLSLLFYILSFHWVWKTSPLPTGENISPLPGFVLINLLVLGSLTIWEWLRLFLQLREGWRKRKQKEEGVVNLYPVGGLLTNSMVGIMIITSALVPYWHLSISSLSVVGVLLFNLLLFLLTAGLVREGWLQGQRRLFWGGMMLLSLQIFSRMLEYNTDLLFKSLILFLCGGSVIAAGLWFERYMLASEGSPKRSNGTEASTNE